MPKTHAANLYELPDDWCKEVMPVAKKCAAVLKDVLDCEGVNVLQNNGALAGQTVFHLHVHLIPRYQERSNGNRHRERIPKSLQKRSVKHLQTKKIKKTSK